MQVFPLLSVSILQHSPHIEELNIAALDIVTDTLLAAIAKAYPKLTIIELNRCMHLANIWCHHLCPVLYNILIVGCTNVSDASVLALAAGPLVCVQAKDTGVTAETVLLLQHSPRIELDMRNWM